MLAWIATVAVILLASAALSYGSWGDLVHGWLPGTDAYMRLMRVHRLMHGASWYDGSIPGSNVPFGEDLHWSRPLDVLLIMAAWLVRPFSRVDPVLIAGLFLPTLLLIASAAALAWMVRPLLREFDTPLAALFAVGQPAIMAYGLPGRADHHHLLLLSALLVSGALARLLLGRRERLAIIGGLSAGFGLWISVEAIVPLALATVVLLVAWLRDAPEPWQKANARFHGAATAVVLVAVTTERPPSKWLTPFLDRVSILHLGLLTSMLLFWAVAAPRVKNHSRVVRGSVAAVCAIVAAALLASVEPRFFLGPFAALDHKLLDVWLPHIGEIQRETFSSGMVVSRVGAPVAAVLATGIMLLGGRTSGRERGARAAILLPLVAMTALGLAQVRWLLYAEAFAAGLLAVAVSDAASALAASRFQPWVRVGLSLAAIVISDPRWHRHQLRHRNNAAPGGARMYRKASGRGSSWSTAERDRHTHRRRAGDGIPHSSHRDWRPVSPQFRE